MLTIWAVVTVFVWATWTFFSEEYDRHPIEYIIVSALWPVVVLITLLGAVLAGVAALSDKLNALGKTYRPKIKEKYDGV